MGPRKHVLDGSRSDESICSREGDKLAMQPSAKLLWTLVVYRYFNTIQFYEVDSLFCILK